MKNKKGFTLVELLAVIAILAILVIISMPNIIEMFNNAKRKSFITEVQTIYRSAQQEFLKDSLTNDDGYIYAKSSDNIKCTKELDITSRGEIRYFIELDRHGKVIRYYATDGEYQYESEEYGLQITNLEDVNNVGKLEKYEEFSISCDGTAVIEDTRVATLDIGSKVNIIMKKLSGQTEVTSSDVSNSTIKAFKKWTRRTLPTDIEKEKVSVSSSDTPIYMWYDNGTIYYFSKTENVYLNANSATLFKNFTALEDISGISSFNVSGVTSMSAMFQNCDSLKSVDLNSWDTSKVTNLAAIFADCDNLTTINISNWDTSNVTNMMSVFNGCKNLLNLDIKNWNVSKVVELRWMFQHCESLTSLDLSNWDTSSLKLMTAAFKCMYNLTSLDLSNFNTSNVTDMNQLFMNNKKMETLDISNFDTSKVTVMANMFSYTNSLKCLNLSNFNTSNVTNMSSMFDNSSSLNILDVSNFDTSKVTDMSYMFSGTSSIKSLDLSNFNTSNVTTMKGMFSTMISLEDLNISNFDTSKVKNMNTMFRFMHKLSDLDLSHFDTSNVTDMSEMFFMSNGIENLNLSSFDTSKVTNMSEMFRSLPSLKTIDISNFDTSNVTSMFGMFWASGNLENIIGIENLNTSKVTTMAQMFSNCNSIKKLDLSKWDVSNVSDFGYDYEDGLRAHRGMFDDAANLEEVDLRGWNLKEDATTSFMFRRCYKLKNIYVSSTWDQTKIGQSKDMFFNARLLPNYNSSIVDKTNAHTGEGGYFTLKD